MMGRVSSRGAAGTGSAVIGRVESNDGTTIAYERTGEGPPLVLVHGTSADHTRWAPVLPLLEPQFTVYAIDRRGRGLSGDTEPFALEREFEDLAAVVDSIGGAVDVVGHSYGALCTLDALARSANIRRAVLYEPPVQTGEPMYMEGVRERLEQMIEAGEREAALVTFFSEVVEMTAEELAQLQAAPSWAARVEAAHTVPREFDDAEYVLEASRFATVSAPVLMLTGSETAPFLRRATEMVHAVLPNSRIHVMEGEAHIANTSSPELFARLVLDFLTADDDAVAAT